MPFLFNMKTIQFTIVLLVCNAFSLFGQDSLLVDKKYFEDQLYAGVTFNILNNKPENLQQKGISTGLQIGFIKDIPLNKKGTTALGIGVGYAYSKYSQNLKIQTSTDDSATEFSLLIDADDFTNKFETHVIEFPFEIRIHRASSPTIYKFLRIYLGGKVSYVISSRSSFSDADESFHIQPLPYVNKWQYGPYFVMGWGTWNLYAYYNANGLFSDAPTSESVNLTDLRSLKIGLQFYIF